MKNISYKSTINLFVKNSAVIDVDDSIITLPDLKDIFCIITMPMENICEQFKSLV